MLLNMVPLSKKTILGSRSMIFDGDQCTQAMKTKKYPRKG